MSASVENKPPVRGTDDGQVVDVRPPTLSVFDVAKGRAFRQLVHGEESRAIHSRWPEDLLGDDVLKALPRDLFHHHT